MIGRKKEIKLLRKAAESVHVTYVTTFGLAKNRYSGEIQSEVTLDDLFDA